MEARMMFLKEGCHFAMKVTIKDIAKRSGVSATTVSRIINNKAEGIRQETRERVLKVIEEMNYRPNSIARSMVTKRTNTIGLIIPSITNPFFPEVVRGVEDVANASQYNVFLGNTDSSFRKEVDYLELMKEKNVDGIIFTGPHESQDEEFYDSMQEYKIPIVLMDRGQQVEHFSGVYTDNVKGGYLATKHLLDLSHRRIGLITGPSNTFSSHERLQGCVKALHEYGLPVDESLILSGNYLLEEGYEAAKVLLQKQVTAIFAFNDLMAYGVYRAAFEMGLSVPEDLSVVGYDNLPYNQLLVPPLTTIDQSAYQMGETAAKLLLNELNNKKAEKKQVIKEPTLIIKGSTQSLK